MVSFSEIYSLPGQINIGPSSDRIIITVSEVTAIVKGGIETSTFGWTVDQLANELTDNFFFDKVSEGGGTDARFTPQMEQFLNNFMSSSNNTN